MGNFRRRIEKLEKQTSPRRICSLADFLSFYPKREPAGVQFSPAMRDFLNIIQAETETPVCAPRPDGQEGQI